MCEHFCEDLFFPRQLKHAFFLDHQAAVAAAAAFTLTGSCAQLLDAEDSRVCVCGSINKQFNLRRINLSTFQWNVCAVPCTSQKLCIYKDALMIINLFKITIQLFAR